MKKPKLPKQIEDHIYGFGKVKPQSVKTYSKWTQNQIKDQFVTLYRGDTIESLNNLKFKKSCGASFTESLAIARKHVKGRHEEAKHYGEPKQIGFIIKVVVPKSAILYSYKLEPKINREYREKEFIVDISQIKQVKLVFSDKK